jgi:hypothetical protein
MADNTTLIPLVQASLDALDGTQNITELLTVKIAASKLSINTAALDVRISALDMSAADSITLVQNAVANTLGGGSGIGDVRLLNVTDVNGLYPSGTEEWLRAGVIETDTASYPDAKVVTMGALGTYASQSFSVQSEDTAPEGMAWDGLHFWVVGRTTDSVYKYTRQGVYTEFSLALLVRIHSLRASCGTAPTSGF